MPGTSQKGPVLSSRVERGLSLEKSQDLMQLKTNTSQIIENNVGLLFEGPTCKSAWVELAKATLARLLVFNAVCPRQVIELQVEDYENRIEIDGAMVNENANTSKQTFPCDRCNKIYHSRGGLYTHRRLECGKQPSYFCPRCSYKTKHKHSLVSHVGSRHPEVLASIVGTDQARSQPVAQLNSQNSSFPQNFQMLEVKAPSQFIAGDFSKMMSDCDPATYQ
ncbi:unnamed protein product [Nesidiocoris tenuis]|uniref:C2H2-type domain-containing protein n=1 Tax=Nesidiocoris tenuis TaxID=355587 RepID=A0A6H5HV78_9HEMI|nr:unnamed protein product [Nesidiocoris tenuis]